jgi:hypothetical protein
LVCVASLRHRLRQFVRIANLAAARDVERRVRYDSMKPRAKRLIRQEPVKGAVRVQKCLLHCVFRVLVIHDDRTRHRVCTTFMRAHEFGKRFAFPSLRREHQRAFVGRTFSHDACPRRHQSR